MPNKKLEDAIRERLDVRSIVRKDSSRSGCISKGYHYVIDDEKSIFVKVNGGLNCRQMFDGEFSSLESIYLTRTIKCPKPIKVIHNYDDKQSCSAIIMDYLHIDSLRPSCAKLLGYNLANLHDYNNKLIRYNEKSSKWIGRRVPSTKSDIHSTNTQKNRKSRKSDDEDDIDDDGESSQFTKHCMKIKDMVISSTKTSSNDRISPTRIDSESEYADRFIPKPGTEEIHRFGFHVPTSCGSISQVNEWTNDWIAFYARNRLDKSIRDILSDRGDRDLMEQWSHLQLKVDKFFTNDFPANQSKIIDSSKIVPSLLHGDLWSGNVAQTTIEGKDEPVIYDPSSFYGHSEYELGIARMFGGFPREFEAAYFEILPKKRDFEKRNKLYQLFHHLNHWSHFGSGYRSSSLSLIKNINTLV